MRKALIDFATIADLEVPIHNLKNGATALHVIAEGCHHDSNMQETLFYLAAKMSDDARELQNWFDVATMATKPDKD